LIILIRKKAWDEEIRNKKDNSGFEKISRPNNSRDKFNNDLRNKKPNKTGFVKYSDHILKKFIKKDRYFKYLKLDHRNNNDDISYKNKFTLSRKQIISKFSILDVESDLPAEKSGNE
jgi:hypothetical protein